MLLCFCMLIFFGDYIFASKYPMGWNYITLHCRNNENEPVNWWHIYKPPTAINLFTATGRNFSYLTPADGGVWKNSIVPITSNSMLQHTLSPLYRKTYSEHLAVIAYRQTDAAIVFGKGKKTKTTSALGIVMSDEIGGFWLGHTVQGLLDDKDKPSIPESEQQYGHSLMCVSMNAETINDFVKTLKTVIRRYEFYKLPNRMKDLLPDWGGVNSMKYETNQGHLPTELEFISDGNYRGSILTKPSGSPVNLYRRFAKQKKIILDVYGNTNLGTATTICGPDYGVRKIDTISFKLPKAEADITGKEIVYIGDLPDKSSFGVSTAANWQQRGAGPAQYWVCFGNRVNSTSQAALLVCMEDYDMWRAFDTLKVNEPKC